MKLPSEKNINYKLLSIIGVILLFVSLYALSWIVCCGLIKLITLCFGLSFKWSVATGIWIIMCIVQAIIKSKR